MPTSLFFSVSMMKFS